ncbi:MAG TPA: hypothetical protein V6C78_10825 [Crinalium sp.]
MATTVWAGASSDRVLMAQRVVDGLPPPPPIPSSQLPPPQIQPDSTPQLSPAPINPAFQPSTSAFSPSSSSSDQRYLVLVNGDSPLLLEQVRKVESGAFLQNYDGRQVIQAGSFMEQNRAQRQQQALESQGIGADVIAVATPTSSVAQADSYAASSVAYNSTLPAPEMTAVAPSASREVVFGQQPNFSTTETRTAQADLVAAASASRYYVAIPGRGSDLNAINEQVTRLGGGLGIANAVNSRTAPLGPHVLVGPFVNRNAAERWNRYLRAFGMDARVYYRR